MTKPNDIIAANAQRLVGTACTDGQGSLLVLHHATNRSFDAFENSADLGFHFGARGQADKRRRNMISRSEAGHDDPWRVVSCVLAIRNPLVIAADPGVWGPRWLTATLLSILNREDREAIRELAAKLHSVRGQNLSVETDAVLRQWLDVLKGALKRAGHDGIVYRNVFENTGRNIEWSWLALDDHQIIPLGDRPALNVTDALGVDVGKPPKLKGTAHPMRHHQETGMGDLTRKSDVNAFREAIERWATSAGIEWRDTVPLDYQPEFGKARPWFDLTAKVGADVGFSISVRSKLGEVVLMPFAPSETAEELLADFRSDHSEGFFDQGLAKEDRETLHWRPAETISTFIRRLDRLAADFRNAFGDMPRPAQTDIGHAEDQGFAP